MIDWPLVEFTYDQILLEVSAMCAPEHWTVKPQKLTTTKHKTKYGMADVDGVVYINQAFIGTTAIGLLDATIRHELAHLCVGLHNGHNHLFKTKAKEFKAIFGRHLKAESEQVHAAIGYKYRLYATLEGSHKNVSEEILFRRVHRKHDKYVSYKPGRFRYLSIQGQKVLAFRYSE